MTDSARLLQLHGVVIDMIYHVDAIPHSGTEAIVSRFQMAPGGGFNAMAAARRSGMSVTYAGAIGHGPLGELVTKGLADEGIEPLFPAARDRDQSCCTVLVEPSGERTFIAADGAEGTDSGVDLNNVVPAHYDWSLLSGYSLFYKGSGDALSNWLAHRTDIPNLVFDPSPVIGSLSRAACAIALDRALWVSANAEEATILTGADCPAQAAEILAEKRPAHGGAVVRDGAQGCVITSGGETTVIPAHKVTPIDTNGAGDTHLGAFIAALARGMDPKEAAMMANVAAALSTQFFGPSTAPDLTTVERTLQTKRSG